MTVIVLKVITTPGPRTRGQLGEEGTENGPDIRPGDGPRQPERHVVNEWRKLRESETTPKTCAHFCICSRPHTIPIEFVPGRDVSHLIREPGTRNCIPVVPPGDRNLNALRPSGTREFFGLRRNVSGGPGL